MDAAGRIVSWQTSSFTGGNGTNCVEVGRTVNWRKSRRSGGNGSACVEVGQSVGAVLVRDTKNRSGGTLAFSQRSWQRFLGAR